MSEQTPARLRALRWFSQRGTVRLFGAGDPSLQMVRRLLKHGLIETVSFGPLQFTGYRINQVGRQAVLDAQRKDGTAGRQGIPGRDN